MTDPSAKRKIHMALGIQAGLKTFDSGNSPLYPALLNCHSNLLVNCKLIVNYKYTDCRGSLFYGPYKVISVHDPKGRYISPKHVLFMKTLFKHFTHYKFGIAELVG